MSGAERFERLELKYPLHASQVAAVKEAIAPWCVADRNNGASGYPIASLYLDSPTLGFYTAWARADADRVKLRVRLYADGQKAHLEIKRKVGQVVHKLRMSVPRERVQDAVAGRWVDPAWSRGAREVLEQFQALQWATGAAPRLWVTYNREAFASTVDAYARVTLDRNMRARPVTPEDWSLAIDPDAPGWVALDRAGELEDGVSSLALLELKCEPLVPRWLSAVIREQGLERCGFSKYARGVEESGLGMSQPLIAWRGIA